ncbi:hypothetical protein Taro_045760 [Colocasia esculenta]|uniref:Uncharacterized protein n=1 Tax=Colocasia esculenta TaxID=4460 RepID=A0A843X6T5_COLES|nr:hypothetical protein [Colocasia esculenta]
MGSNSDGGSSGGGSRVRGLVLKALVLIGGALLLKRLTKATTRWDHARIVAEALSGEKFSREQASRDPDNYFNLRGINMRFYMVKPCPKEMKCDVEPYISGLAHFGRMVHVWHDNLSTYAIRDAEEYKNFCDRSKDQRPQEEEVIAV